MNFSQRLGLFILIIISISYVYFSFFHKEIKLSDFNNSKNNSTSYNPLETEQNKDKIGNVSSKKNIKIFILDETGNLKPVKRECDPQIENSCFAYAIKELIIAPSRIEKAKGYTSEIPQGTKVLSIRESSNSIMIDLSSAFESGGGAESTYTRIKQIIKTANANTTIPTYLYINGKQANVIGGEGIMIKQPLNERSFDE